MPNCSHSSVTVKCPLRASITNRIISSIGVIFIQGIRPGSVTHHPGLFVTYLAGSNPASSGRWLSRDPIGERGGRNLYGMVRNDPVNHWDLLGLDINQVSSVSLPADQCCD